MNPDYYWLIRDGEKTGPFSLGEVARRIRAGELTASDPAWRGGMDAWTPLGQIEELLGVFEESKTHDSATSGALPVLPPPLPTPPPGPPPLPRTTTTPVYRRFFARWFDLQTYMVFCLAALGATGQNIISFYKSPWVALAFFLPWFLIEAVWIHLAATTPGKALLGLRVVNRDGSRLSLGAALQRSLRVYIIGFGLGWALLCPICQALAWFTVRRTGETLWDLSGGHRVEVRQEPAWHIAIRVVLFIIFMQVAGVLLEPVVKPAVDEMIRNASPELREMYEKLQAALDVPKSP